MTRSNRCPQSHFGLLAAIFSVFSGYQALADNIDPFEKRILVRTNPALFARGVCPGSPAVTPIAVQPLSRSDLTLNESIHRDLKYKNALTAADKVYDLPDYESVRSGQQFVSEFSAFQKSLPNGYRLYAYFGEPETGIKYMILQPDETFRPPQRIGKPWILSIAGTRTLIDVVSDLDMGRNQLQKMSRIRSIFTTCQFMDEKNRPLSEKSWIFTGHSLGGGLAQAFAYQVQEIRLAQKLSPLKLELLTFNAFGAQELVKKDGTYDSRLLQYIEARNYFLYGEPISKIGHHIGPTYVLAEDGVMVEQSPRYSLREQIKRHSLDSILTAIEQVFQSKLNDDDNMQSPPTSEPLSYLSRYGSFVRVITPAIYEQSEDRTVRILEEAALAVVQNNDPATKSYIRRLIHARLNYLRRPSNGIMAELLVSRLERAQAQLAR